jgi:hypothetical protein
MVGIRQRWRAQASGGPIMWIYKGIAVFLADFNSSGIRYYARTDNGILRSSTKQGMRELINARNVR